MSDIISEAQPDDIPIRPGETHTFRIHPGQVPAWEYSVSEGNHPEALKIKAKLEMLSFGDGTGYFGDHPYAPPARQQSMFNPSLSSIKSPRLVV